MSRSPISLLSIVCCALLAGIAQTASASPQGPVTQPAAAGAAAPAQADPEAELKALLNSPEARSVAAFRCSSADTACPLTDAAAATFGERFEDTLLTGAGTSTPLIGTLQKLLESDHSSGAVWPSTVPYAIVHLLKFNDTGESHRARWLLFRRHKGVITVSSGTRIMGAKRLAVIFIHLGVEVQLERFDSDTNEKRAVAPPEAASDFYAGVEYRAIAKPKLPVNVQRLIGLLKVATKTQAAAAIRTRKMAMLGFGVYEGVPVPSDVTVFGARLGAVPLGFGKPITYDNEGKYMWDVSVAVPVNKITLLEYEDEEDTFHPKSINKQSIFGTINLYPFPVDLKEGTLRWIVPRAVVGIGMTGRPGENFLLAGAFGFKEIQVFVGSTFANQRVLKPGADPADGANYTQRYASRLTYGINVPVLSVLKQLTDGK